MVQTLDNAADATAIRTAILGYLRTHRAWYKRSSNRYWWSLNFLSFLIVVLGTATSVLNAVPPEKTRPLQALMIIMPAVAALCAALLAQFRIRDMSRLREIGRIKSEYLIAEALKLPKEIDAATAMDSAVALRTRAHEIEWQQLDGAFDVAGPAKSNDAPATTA